MADVKLPEGTDWIVPSDPVSGVKLPVRLRASDDYVVLHRHWIPRTIELEVSNPSEPRVYAKVEVSEFGQKLVALEFDASGTNSRSIRQQDLRDIEVRALLEDVVAGFTFEVRPDGTVSAPYIDTPAYEAARSFVSRQRAGETSRNITDDLLRDVAEVYRQNIHGHPNQAVETYFGVRPRTAAEYVFRARKRGYLPKTKRGQKKA